MLDDVKYYTYPSPLGKITLAENEKGLIYLDFGEHALNGQHHATPLLNQAANELQEYFAGKRRAFDIPLHPIGSSFETQVWRSLEQIPYGEAKSSSEVAALLGNPKAHQAVGRAAKKNPIPILIPSHRLITTTPTPLTLRLRELEQS